MKCFVSHDTELRTVVKIADSLKPHFCMIFCPDDGNDASGLGFDGSFKPRKSICHKVSKISISKSYTIFGSHFSSQFRFFGIFDKIL